MIRYETRYSLIEALDGYVERYGLPNLRGSMARVSGSRYYRPPPVGCPTDEPTTATLDRWLYQARLEARVTAARA